ncbi:hypothetical protein HGA91_06435 [candidate division WWE3 bacterium]|nr:hypothetical protein [candidate division WWE3 bacterium]
MATSAGSRAQLKSVIEALGEVYTVALDLGYNPQPGLDRRIFARMASAAHNGTHIVIGIQRAAKRAKELGIEMNPTDWLPYLGAFGINSYELLLLAIGDYTFQIVGDDLTSAIVAGLKPWDFPGYEGWRPEESGK